jgi:hypothetical protein
MNAQPVRRSRTTTAIPRWVKVFALIFVSMLLLFALLHLDGSGFEHIPAR